MPDSVTEERSDGQTEDKADKQTDRQLEGSDDPTMQREIEGGLMVTEESARSRRQIIRQAANAELLAEDLSQTRPASLCHVYPRKQMLSCQSFIQFSLTGCLIPATCCVHVCVVCGVWVCKLSFILNCIRAANP